jgi:hypothetical protein
VALIAAPLAFIGRLHAGWLWILSVWWLLIGAQDIRDWFLERSVLAISGSIWSAVSSVAALAIAILTICYLARGIFAQRMTR